MNWSQVVKDNPWLVPVLAATSIGVSFATAGLIWGLFSTYLFVFVAVVALSRSRTLRKTSAAREVDVAPPDVERREPEPWAKRSGAELTHSLDLVPEMADSASADSIPAEEERTPGSKQVQRPILDAMVASTKEDPAGVRRALKSWVRHAPDLETQVERQAQLHYWLYRAGDAGDLEKLKALAAANPNLPEVTLYLRLALQEYDELWS